MTALRTTVLRTTVLRTTALLRRLYIKALRRASCRASCRALCEASVRRASCRASCRQEIEIWHFYPYRLRYFMHFLLDKGYFMLAYSHYPKPPCQCQELLPGSCPDGI